MGASSCVNNLEKLAPMGRSYEGRYNLPIALHRNSSCPPAPNPSSAN